MNLGEALNDASSRLREAGIDDARLEAEVLLRDSLGITREELYARLQEPLEARREQDYESLTATTPAATTIGHQRLVCLVAGCASATPVLESRCNRFKSLRRSAAL